MKAIIIDDSTEEADLLRRALEQKGFACVVETFGDAGLAKLKNGSFDVAVVDSRFKGQSITGSDIVLKARDAGVETPIMCVSQYTGAEDRAVDLENGASDCMAKPVHPREFLARIMQMVKRHEHAVPETALSCGCVTLDMKDRTATYCGHAINLDRLQFDLLALLVRAEGRLVPSTAIRKLLGLTARSENSPALDPNGVVRTAVKRLRDALTAHGDPDPVFNERGAGYAIR